MRRLLVLGFLLGFASATDASPAAARQARALLGPEVWSRVIRIENERPGAYPAEVYATVFAFDGILWFYTGLEGTQSLSLRRGRLERDQADLAPLLAAIDPGFVRHEILPEQNGNADSPDAPLPHGCFVNSVVALHRLLAGDRPLTGATLLSYYFDGGRRVKGHTVLVYATPEGWFYQDADLGPGPRPLAGMPGEPPALLAAREIQRTGPGRSRVTGARWVGEPPALWRYAGEPPARADGPG
ncbi:MAG: hypothetical protein KIT44_00190 [Opitutaceae bacterium]|nr:hypothetical protein [Opitutaceae bacterium]